jgi:hypothetical protein
MANKLVGPVDTAIHKINIAGFSMDNFKTLNFEGYTILCRLGETCEGLHYFPSTYKIILDINEQSCFFHNNLETGFITKIAEDLQISQQGAIETSVDFFSNKTIFVQPVGLQGKIYNMMRYTQNSVPMMYTYEAVSIVKMTGMTGIQIVTRAPLTFVGATYIGALFFGYCGSVAGNNPVGSICNFTSFALTRPMRGVEMTLNGLILRPISNLVGLPLILNGTQEMLNGRGMSIQEYAKIGIAFERISNSTAVKKAKEIYKIFRS